MPGNDLDLALRIRADVQQALVGMRNMDRSLGNIDKRGKRADRTMRSMVRTALRLGGAYLGFRAVIGVFRSVIAKTEEQAQAIAQVERGLRNLDRQTTLTSAGLQAHAAALQQVTTTGDEATLKLQALLLTFRKIDDTNFNRVTEAALDMAAGLGQAPRDAALQLAKALEDPAQGLTALRRSGTAFSAEQTEVIKSLAETNRLAEAQTLILAEVESQYRGAARAQRETVGGAGAGLGNAFGDLLEARDGAEDLRVEIEGLTAAVKDPGFSAAVRGFVDVFVSGLAAIAAGRAEVVAGLGDIYAQLNPDLETRRNRVRRYGTTGEGLTLEEVRRNQGLRAIAEGQLAQLRETIAQQEAEIAANEAAIARPVADQRRQQADIAAANRQAAEAADLGFGRQLRPEAPTIADQERAELERQRGVLAQRVQAAERLARLLSLADAGNVPSGFTLPGPLPARFARPVVPGPSAEEVKAAEAAAREVEAIAAASQDRLAQLTLSRVELIDREEGQALAELRRLGETRGVDAAEVEAAILATQEASAAERHDLRVEGLAREHDALVASLEAGAEARREAAEREAKREADALAEIEGREVDLGIVGEYEAAIRAANRWRDATLADLDAAGGGHEKLRDRALAVHARMVETAREAARDQAAAGTSWTDGARKALGELGQETDWADTAERATLRAFRSMEDALVNFVTTGKLSFADLTKSILADLARIAIQQAITIPLANSLFSLFGPAPGAPTTGSGFGGATPPPVGYYPVGHAGAVAGQLGGVRRAVPPAIFAEAQRYHAGGIAGLRPDEIPVIARRGEGIFTPEQMRALGSPNVTVELENRGAPKREVRREVRFDPRGMVVSIVIDDLDRNGPISQTMRRNIGS